MLHLKCKLKKNVITCCGNPEWIREHLCIEKPNMLLANSNEIGNECFGLCFHPAVQFLQVQLSHRLCVSPTFRVMILLQNEPQTNQPLFLCKHWLCTEEGVWKKPTHSLFPTIAGWFFQPFNIWSFFFFFYFSHISLNNFNLTLR